MSRLCGMGEEMLGIHWTLAQPCCISRRWLNDEELKVSFYPRKCRTDGGMCVRPSPLHAKALTPGRSSDPEDLVHSPCACCLSRSAHVWNSASAPERWDGVFCENIFLLVLQAKEETQCPAYHLEAIGTKGRLLFIFSSVIQKILGALITASLPSKAMPDDRRVECKSHHEPPSLPLLLLPMMQSWWLLLRRLLLPLNELRRCPSPRAKSFSVGIVGAVAPSLAVHQSVEGYY